MVWLDYISQFGISGTGNGQFDFPNDVAVDSSNIYVVDFFNYRVQVFDTSAVFISKFGEYGATNGKFNYPESVAIDSSNIYVTDVNNHRVQVFDRSNNAYITQFGSYGSIDGKFSFPAGIFVDSSSIYVVDNGNDRIQIFDKSDYSFVSKFGTSGSGNGQFISPQGICVDATRIYVTDWLRNNVQVFNKSNNAYITKFGGYGSANGKFNGASRIAVNYNYIYVTDYYNNRVQVFNKTTFDFINKFGTSGTGNGQFDNPHGITLGLDKIYVTDAQNNRVQVFNNIYSDVPEAPSNLDVYSENGSDIGLTWQINSIVETGFKIEKSLDGISWNQIDTVGVGVNTYIATGNDFNAENHFRIRAYNLSGNSSYSNIIIFPGTYAPFAPTDLVLTCGAIYSMILDWQSHSTIETGFKIEKSLSGEATSWSQIATVGAGILTYTATGIIQGQVTYFRVRAYNVSGNSGYSNIESLSCVNPDAIAAGNRPRQITINIGGGLTEVWVIYSREKQLYVIKRDSSENWGTEININAGTDPDIYHFDNKICVVFNFNGKIFYRQWDSSSNPSFIHKPGQLVDCFRMGQDISYDNLYIPFYNMTPYSLAKSGLDAWTWSILSDTNIVNYGYNFYEIDDLSNITKLNGSLLQSASYTYTGISQYSYYVTAEVYNWYEQRGYETNNSNTIFVPIYVWEVNKPENSVNLTGFDLSYSSLFSLVIVEVNANNPLIDSDSIVGSDLHYQSLASLIIVEVNQYDPLIDAEYLIGYDISLAYISASFGAEGQYT